MTKSSIQRPLNIALVGNPNCGKTALFNRFTGSRQKVANYAGVTVERKVGQFVLPSGRAVQIVDLPGSYGLAATSPDEEITRDVCLGSFEGEEPLDLIVCVVDASNLRLHLRFVLELRQLGRPLVLALNMMDAAHARGIQIDTQALSKQLDMPVFETIAVRHDGAQALIAALDGALPSPPQPLPEGSDLHKVVRDILSLTLKMPRPTSIVDDRIDRWVLHPVLGLVILAGIMFFVFQAVFAWAAPFQDGIESLMRLLAEQTGALMPEGPLKGLVQDGIIAGAGSVLVFLPQILFLFFFIILLEESGYLPRAAFLLDRFMVGAGLTGRSFIPLLSSFACAVPGIMATRTIQDPRDRLATILVAPLMTCSARLPVYTLLIGAFIPDQKVLGLFNLQGLVLFSLYLFGIFSALVVAYAIKHLMRSKAEHSLLLELPSYRLPNIRSVARGLADRAKIFVRRVGTIIFVLSVLLWFISSYPTPPASWVHPAIEYSFAGRLGIALETVFAPIGFNWQICIALIPGFAAREVAVSGLATVYAVSALSEEATTHALGSFLSTHWGLPTALSLLAWYVFSPQCISTIATIRRETNSWKITGLSTGYLLALAYIAALVTYHLALFFVR